MVSERFDTAALATSFGRIRDVCARVQSGNHLAFNLKLLCDSLLQEGAVSGVFLWNAGHGEALHYAYTFGEHFHNWQNNHSIHTDARGFINTDLRARIFGNESYFVVDVFEEIRDTAAHTLEAFINAWNEMKRSHVNGAEIGCLLVFPCHRDEQKRGALIIPIEVGPSLPSPSEGVTPGATHPPKMDILRALPATIQTLNTYASIAHNIIGGATGEKQAR
jgi:hypothetical protein